MLYSPWWVIWTLCIKTLTRIFSWMFRWHTEQPNLSFYLLFTLQPLFMETSCSLMHCVNHLICFLFTAVCTLSDLSEHVGITAVVCFVTTWERCLFERSKCLICDFRLLLSIVSLFMPHCFRKNDLGVLLTLGGLAVSDHEGSHFIPRGQQLPLGIFPAHALKEPSEQQETDQLVQKLLNGSKRSFFHCCVLCFHVHYYFVTHWYIT